MIRRLLCLVCLLSACSSVKPVEKETQWAIRSITFAEWPEATVQIDNDAHTVSIILPHGSKAGKSVVDIQLDKGITSVPASGETTDLATLKAIYLSDAKGSAMRYAVTVSVRASSSTAFSSMCETRYLVKAWPSGNKLSFRLPFGADLQHLSFEADTPEALRFAPSISDIDLSSPREVSVIAADGETTRKITLEASLYPKDTGVRGVYLPSPSHTGSFLSYSEVCKSLDLLASLNFNCLFVCAWAASKTAWNSDVLKENSTWPTRAAGNMYASYTGGSGDAVRDIIEAAHARGIKVILWFEYGFMHGIGGVNKSDPVLAKHPSWMGIRDDGSACHYNDTDYYLNGYDPDVQKFMLDLMKEAVTRYPDVDGIQGDDRLPAMPRNSGYDEATQARYLAATGKAAPADYNNADWVRWRLDVLNGFAAKMHTELKALKPSLIVCFAPNKYPWCENVLMQDWPGWIADGSVDLLTVQCYVIARYEEDASATLDIVREKTDAPLFNPAMILKNGDAILPVDKIAAQLQYNRQIGTFGESQFWFDGLKIPEVQEIFKAYYSYPVPFPNL